MESARLSDTKRGDSDKVRHFKYLLRLPYHERKKLPALSAVYFVHTSEGLILYIGATINLKSRFSAPAWGWEIERLNGKVTAVSVAWLPVPTEHLRAIEVPLIKDIQPPLNRIYTSSWLTGNILKKYVQRYSK